MSDDLTQRAGPVAGHSSTVEVISMKCEMTLKKKSKDFMRWKDNHAYVSKGEKLGSQSHLSQSTALYQS